MDGHHGNSPLTAFPTPQSSLLLDFDESACKRLITDVLSKDQVVFLIGRIFTSEDEVKIIGYLRGGEAQTFIDVIDEVRFHVRSSLRPGLILTFFVGLASANLYQPGLGLCPSLTSASEEVFERSVQNLRPSGFASEIIKNPTLLRSIGHPALSWRVR